MTKTVVVVNPGAGRGRSAHLWRELYGSEPRLADAHVVESALPEVACKELDRLLEAGCERVLVIGGDGSAHLVANRVLELGLGERVVLGLLPTVISTDRSYSNVPTDLQGRRRSHGPACRVQRAQKRVE